MDSPRSHKHILVHLEWKPIGRDQREIRIGRLVRLVGSSIVFFFFQLGEVFEHDDAVRVRGGEGCCRRRRHDAESEGVSSIPKEVYQSIEAVQEEE